MERLLSGFRHEYRGRLAVNEVRLLSGEREVDGVGRGRRRKQVADYEVGVLGERRYRYYSCRP